MRHCVVEVLWALYYPVSYCVSCQKYGFIILCTTSFKTSCNLVFSLKHRSEQPRNRDLSVWSFRDLVGGEPTPGVLPISRKISAWTTTNRCTQTWFFFYQLSKTKFLISSPKTTILMTDEGKLLCGLASGGLWPMVLLFARCLVVFTKQLSVFGGILWLLKLVTNALEQI